MFIDARAEIPPEAYSLTCRVTNQKPMYLYVELWKARPAWLDLSTEERRQYFKNVGAEIEKLTEEGLEVVGFAINDEETPHRSEHRYMAVWKMPTRKHAEQLEESVAEAGWHDYFEQVNARGERIAPQEALAELAQLETTGG